VLLAQIEQEVVDAKWTLCPGTSDVDLLTKLDSVINLDAEIPGRPSGNKAAIIPACDPA
jgi:hypothetical protein